MQQYNSGSVRGTGLGQAYLLKTVYADPSTGTKQHENDFLWRCTAEAPHDLAMIACSVWRRSPDSFAVAGTGQLAAYTA